LGDRARVRLAWTAPVFGARGVMRQAVAMQIRAVDVEPYLGPAHVGAHALHQLPELLRVVHLDEVRDLVGGEIVEHETRREHETPRERQHSGGGT